MAERRGFRFDLVRLSAALPVGALLEPVLMRATTTPRNDAPPPTPAPIGAVQPVVSLRGAIHPAP